MNLKIMSVKHFEKMQAITGIMPQFHPKISKPKSLQFVVFCTVSLQFLNTFVNKNFQNTQKRTN